MDAAEAAYDRAKADEASATAAVSQARAARVPTKRTSPRR